MRSGFLGRGIGPRAFGGGGVPPTPVPVAGAELLANGGFAAASDWGLDAFWTIDSGMLNVAATGAAYATQGVIGGSTNDWLVGTFDLVSRTQGGINQYVGGTAGIVNTTTGTKVTTKRTTNAASPVCLFEASGNAIATLDNASVKRLTFSSLLSARAYASPDCDLSAAVTRTAGTQAGLCARLDSASSPANFIIAYETGAGRVRVDKCVAGVYTNIIDDAVTYAAGRVLRLVCSGNDVSAYYNGAQVGSTVTVSDAGIVSNVRHGLFSTYAANTFTNYMAA